MHVRFHFQDEARSFIKRLDVGVQDSLEPAAAAVFLYCKGRPGKQGIMVFVGLVFGFVVGVGLMTGLHYCMLHRSRKRIQKVLLLKLLIPPDNIHIGFA